MVSLRYLSRTARDRSVLWICSYTLIHKYKFDFCDSSSRLSNDAGLKKHSMERNTVCHALESWKQSLESAGVTEAKESVEHILAHVLGSRKISSVYENYRRKLTDVQLELMSRLCECRLARMPVQYILGEWEFRELQLKMIPPVFIPRPETELLVDLALKHLHPGDRVLEVGCGTGAISLALLNSCPQIQCLAVDHSSTACVLTQQNAKHLGLDNRLTVNCSKLTENGLEGINCTEVDLIVSNPPYVPRSDLLRVQPEIMVYEDLRALDGGVDGLDVIKPLLKLTETWLVPGGRCLLEVDSSHPVLIREWLEQENSLHLKFVQSFQDFSGKDRFIEIKQSSGEL